LQKKQVVSHIIFLWEEDLKNINIEKLSLHNAGLIFEKIYRDNTVSDRGLYIIAAAYIAFVSQDFTKAKSLLSDAKNTNLNDRLKDQLQLIELLVAANENARLDTYAEQSILASVKWLIEKGKNDEGYKLFLRNFFSQIIAQKYEQQGDQDKAALAYGVADLMFVDTGKAVDEVYFSTTYGIDYIRNEMDTQQALKLYALLNAKILSPYDQLLIANSSFDLAVLEVTEHGFKLLERAPGVSIEEIKTKTAGKIIIENDVTEMSHSLYAG
jgi:hypothetical protein